MPSSPDQRCAAAEAILAKMRSVGIALYDDPAVGDFIDEWINGRLGMPEVLERYQQLLKDRYASRCKNAASHSHRLTEQPVEMSTPDLLEGMEKLISDT
jgi:hypothetical protein